MALCHVAWQYNVKKDFIHKAPFPRTNVSTLKMKRKREWEYLKWVFGADGQDLELEVADLTAPRASLTDPADKAGLVSTTHRASTATRAQQLPLQDNTSSYIQQDLEAMIESESSKIWFGEDDSTNKDDDLYHEYNYLPPQPCHCYCHNIST